MNSRDGSESDAEHGSLASSCAHARFNRILLVFAFVAAALFRFLPINYGDPQPGYFSSDEIDAVSRALKMGTGDLLPIHANKPTFYNAVLAGCYGVQFVASKALHGAGRKDFEKKFFMSPFGFYRLARGVSIAASVGLLVLVLAMLRGVHPCARLLSALLLGLAPSSVYYGHVAKEDALAAFLTFASFTASSKAFLPQGRPGNADTGSRWIRVSALFAGLAISTKYNCFFCVAFPAIAWWIATPPGRPRLRASTLLVSLIAIGFAIGTPYAVLHPVRFVERTLGSAVASQVTGAYNILAYAGNRGPVFALAILWREFGVALPVAVAGLGCLATGFRAQRWLVLVPTAVYLATLCLSSQLDYQYVIVISPVIIYGAAQGFSDLAAATHSLRASVIRWSLLVAGSLVILACSMHLLRVTRQTAEFLGGDTRLVAGKWLVAEATRRDLRTKPMLIASGYYYHYYPGISFDAETYRQLHQYARSTGTEGDYFCKAEQYLGNSTGPQFPARFLDIRTGFRRDPNAELRFEPQAFSLSISDYSGKHSLVVLPAHTLRLLEKPVSGLQPLQEFVGYLAALPDVKTFDPVPWRLAGPKIRIVQGP